MSCQQVMNQQAKCASILFVMIVCCSCHVLLHPFSFVPARDHVNRHCCSRFKTSSHCQQLCCASKMLLVSRIHAKSHVGRFPNQRTRTHVRSCHSSTHDRPAGLRPAGYVENRRDPMKLCNHVCRTCVSRFKTSRRSHHLHL